LRIDEVERLKIELFKPRDEEDVNKFYHFVSLLDLTRNVQVGDYLEEWKVPFENYIKNKDILI
jgi:hypothetical protein